MVPLDRRVWYEATSLRDGGCDVTVICPAATGAHAGNAADKTFIKYPQVLEGIFIYRFPLVFSEGGSWSYLVEFATAFFWIAFLTLKIWLERKFDIIHFCNPPDIFFPLGLLYRLLGAKFIFDHHDLFTENIAWRYKGIKKRILYPLARFCERMTFKCANLVISTNETYRRIAIERGQLPENKVVIVRNGPKISEFQPIVSGQAEKKEYRYLVGFVGVFGEEDGLLEFIDSIRHIVMDRKREDIHFAIIGDGSVRMRAFEKIKELQLDRFIEMPGMIRDLHMLIRKMSLADLFVSPEPFTPMNSASTFVKIGEYMAIGKPIVAYDLKESRFTAGDAALYIQPGDPCAFGEGIIRLLDDPARRKVMGEYGRARFMQVLAWEHQEKALLSTYESLLADKGGKRQSR